MDVEPATCCHVPFRRRQRIAEEPTINCVPLRRPARAVVALVDPHVPIDDAVIIDPRHNDRREATRQPLGPVPNPSDPGSGVGLTRRGGGEIKHRRER